MPYNSSTERPREPKSGLTQAEHARVTREFTQQIIKSLTLENHPVHERPHVKRYDNAPLDQLGQGADRLTPCGCDTGRLPASPDAIDHLPIIFTS